MSSIRFTSFGAATVPLSKIIVDRTLDMGDYPLVGQKIMAPYRPYTWETEPLPYDDRSPTTIEEGSRGLLGLTDEQLITTWYCNSPKPTYVRAIITSNRNYAALKGARIVISGYTYYTTGSWSKGETKTTDAFYVVPGDVFELYVTGPGVIQNYSLVDTGHEAPVNLDLKGRFLALEQDFGNLIVTLTFGDERGVPFSDYPNRFPYAPDIINVWRHKLEDRPVIKVYKGV